MKKTIITLTILVLSSIASAQDLPKPDMSRPTTLMEALQNRQATRQWDSKEITPQDLSDLLWAACGVNRPDGRRTAPSAKNRQNVKLYIAFPDGAYLYNAPKHSLEKVSDTDARFVEAPACIYLVTSIDDSMIGVDVGVISQNISLMCAAAGIATVPRALMNKEVIAKALNLPEGSTLQLNHPIGYFK